MIWYCDGWKILGVTSQKYNYNTCYGLAITKTITNDEIFTHEIKKRDR